MVKIEVDSEQLCQCCLVRVTGIDEISRAKLLKKLEEQKGDIV